MEAAVVEAFEGEHPDVERAIAASAEVAEKYLDLDGLWNIACSATPMTLPDEQLMEAVQSQPGEAITIGVIQDRAFQFYYPDNLEALEQSGAKR